jgi:hypothetical protein
MDEMACPECFLSVAEVIIKLLHKMYDKPIVTVDWSKRRI